MNVKIRQYRFLVLRILLLAESVWMVRHFDLNNCFVSLVLPSERIFILAFGSRSPNSWQ